MNPIPHAQHRRAIWMLLLANFLWGISFPLVKSIAILHERLVPGSSSWFISASVLVPRFALSAAILGAICWSQLRTLTRLEWKQGVGLGLFASLAMLFQNDGLQFTHASTSAFLTQFYAIMIPVYLALRSRRAPPWTVWVSCSLVLAGAAILAGLDWRDLRIGRGELETLVSSVFFMGQILWLERPEFAGNRALPVTVVMFGLLALLAAGVGGMLAPPGATVLALAGNGPWLGFTLVLTVLCTLVSFTLMNWWQPKITATEAGVLYCSEPVFTAAMALFLPGWLGGWAALEYANETATRSLVVGGGLITAANLLIQLRPPRRGAAPA
jgi:drug/metabolite transporter (DMT)-like permease